MTRRRQPAVQQPLPEPEFRVIHTMPVEGNAWEQWKARVWNQMAERFNAYPGLAPLEQWTWRSFKEKRCIECGDPGTERQQSHLIKVVDHYWMCAECADYWRRKAA